MCGRFAFFAPPAAIARQFDVPEPGGPEPRYNIAPSQPVGVVRHDGAGVRTLDMLRWGLVPSWAKDPSIGNRLINARGETVAEKPAFRAAFARRRCLVLASGFYEWAATPSGKRPFYISSSAGEILAFAGLWERWQKNDAPVLETCVIITAAASPFLASVHDRMPVILSPDAQSLWLAADTGAARSKLLKPIEYPGLTMWPVGRRVNDPRNEGAALLERASDASA